MLRALIFCLFFLTSVLFSQEDPFAFYEYADENPEKASTTKSSLTTPVSGDLKVVFIEYSFPDYPRDVAKYTDKFNAAGHYMKNLGTYPDGSSIYDDIHNNGPIIAAELQKDAVTHFFETMSHGNIDVTFDIPRNPRQTTGMWYTAHDSSYYKPANKYAQRSILDSVYHFFPSLINNANYIYFYEPHLSQAHTWVGALYLSNGTQIYHGALAESPGNIFWEQTMMLISH